MNMLIALLGIVITILLVVGVHEFGHFIVARLVGIKVLRFSIGFGKALYSKKDKHGTEFVIAAIPLGGYVKMVDEQEEEVAPADLPYAFNRQPLYKRMLVVIAGPIFNLVFAALIYWLLFVIGFTTVIPAIGKILPNSIAAHAGMKPDQEITQIDQSPTMSWSAVIIKIFERAGEKNSMQIQTKPFNAEQPENYTLDLATWHLDDLKPDPLQSLGIVPYEPIMPAVIDTIKEKSPAMIAGLKPHDKIISIDKEPVFDWLAFIKIISSSPDKTLSFKIIRDQKIVNLSVTTGHQFIFFKRYGYLGVSPQASFPKNLLREQKYSALEAIPRSYQELKNFTYLNLMTFGKLITGKVSLKSLGGPITIFESAGTALNNGIIPFLSFLAFLSIAIGIINIFPIPGLDGGHFLFQMMELILRRPLSERTQALLTRLGIILLVLLIFQAVINDILRL